MTRALRTPSPASDSATATRRRRVRLCLCLPLLFCAAVPAEEAVPPAPAPNEAAALRPGDWAEYEIDIAGSLGVTREAASAAGEGGNTAAAAPSAPGMGPPILCRMTLTAMRPQAIDVRLDIRLAGRDFSFERKDFDPASLAEAMGYAPGTLDEPVEGSSVYVLGERRIPVHTVRWSNVEYKGDMHAVERWTSPEVPFGLVWAVAEKNRVRVKLRGFGRGTAPPFPLPATGTDGQAAPPEEKETPTR